MRCCSAWKEAIATPNCLRVFVYSTVLPSSASIAPTASAQTQSVARSILMMALMAAEAGEALTRPVSAAKSRIGRAMRRLGQEAIQLHGGIGVTDELDVGHYFKRLTAIETLFGNTDFHLQRFGASHDR